MLTEDFAEVKEKPFYQLGGNLPADAPSYVRRAADMDLLNHLMAGRFCYVLTSRQMGKSSLMVQTARRLRESGARVAVLDLTRIGQNLSPEQWYDGLLIPLGREFNLEDELDDFWNSDDAAIAKLGPMQRWMTAVREVILKAIPNNVVIFVDEIDAVRGLPFSTDEFFSGIRQMFNERTFNPDLERITFCLLGVAKPSDLVRNINTTPFNVGYRIELTDFTQEEAAPLLDGLGHNPATAKKLLGRVLWWTGGHPYLTQRLCSGVAADPTVLTEKDVDRVCTDIFLSSRAREKDDNLLFVRERVLRSELDRASLLDLYERVHEGKSIQDDDSSPLIDTLRLAGIVKVAGNKLVVRNRIYAYVFDKTWIQHNMPDAELRRQRRAFRKGLTLAATLSAVVLGLIFVLGLFGWYERSVARQSALRTAARNYDADMTSAGEDFDRGDYAAGSLLLSRWMASVDSKWRDVVTDENLVNNTGFEWNWLWSRYSGDSATTYYGHWGPVKDVAISPDGSLVVTAGADATVRVFRAHASCAAGSPREAGYQSPQITKDRAGNISSPVPARLLVESTAKVTGPVGAGNVFCFPLQNVLELHQDQPPVTLSPDDTDHWLKLSAFYRSSVSPADRALAEGAVSVQFSPDEMWIAVLTQNSNARPGYGTVYLWSTIDPQTTLTFRPPADATIEALYFTNGSSFTTVDQHNIARRYEIDPVSHVVRKTFEQSAPPDANRREVGRHVNAAAFSDDGKYCAMAMSDGSLDILDTTSPVSNVTSNGEVFSVAGLSAVAFYDDDTVLVGSEDNKVLRIDRTSFAHTPVMVQSGEGRVTSLTLSKDKSLLITTSSNSTVAVSRLKVFDKVLSVEDQQLLRGHRAQVNAAAVHVAPDPKDPNDYTMIVSASDDHGVRFWAVPPYQKSDPPPVPGSVPAFASLSKRFPAFDAGGAVRSLSFDPKSNRHYLVYVRGNATGSLLAEHDKQINSSVNGLKDGPVEANKSRQDPYTKVLFYDLSGKPNYESEWPKDLPKIRWIPHWFGTALAYSPDGRFLATGSSDGSVQLWNPEAVWKSTKYVENARYEADANGQAYIQDLLPAANTSEQLGVRTVVFSPDGTLAATRRDGSIVLWKPDTKSKSGYTQLTHLPQQFAGGPLAFSPDGRLIAVCSSTSASQKPVAVWQSLDLENPAATPLELNGREEPPADGSLEARLKARMSSLRKHTVEKADPPEALTGTCSAIAFSPDGQWLAAGTNSGDIALWQQADGRWYRVTAEQYTQVVGDTAKSRWPRAPASASAGVNSIVFSPPDKNSPERKLLAYGSADATIHMWDLSTARRLPSIKVHTGSVLSIAFSPNGRCLASGSTDRNLVITPTAEPNLTNMDWIPFGSFWSSCYDEAPSEQRIGAPTR